MALVKTVVLYILLAAITACSGEGDRGGSNTNSITNSVNSSSSNSTFESNGGSGNTLRSITVSPSNVWIGVGETLQMTATGLYEDGSRSDITNSVFWLSASDVRSIPDIEDIYPSNLDTPIGIEDFPLITTITQSGLLTAVAPGTDIVSAFSTDQAVQGVRFVDVSSFNLEGSVESPVDVSVNTQYTGEVSWRYDEQESYSYYAATVTPGDAYYIYLTDLSGNAELEIYDDSEFSNLVCGSQNYGSECYAAGPTGGVLYIAVSGRSARFSDGRGANYTLEVRSGYRSEGTTAIPVQLPLNTPVSAQAGERIYGSMSSISTYQAPIAATGRYTVSVTDASGTVDLDMRDGPLANVVLFCDTPADNTDDNTCSFQARTSDTFAFVSNQGTQAGVSYTISITEDHGSYEVEGTADNPVDLASLPYEGQVGGVNRWQNSYYRIPVTEQQSVEIVATNVDGPLSLTVYDGNTGFSDTSTCSDHTRDGDEDLSCKIEPATTDAVYVKLFTSDLGTAATLDARPIDYSAQGSATRPEVITTAAVYDAPFSGTVDSAASYYKMPVSDGELYLAGLTNVSGDVSLTVYDDSNLTRMLCSSNSADLADESCRLTPSDSSVWVVVGGATYGSRFSLSMDRVYAQQGSPDDPYDITGYFPVYTDAETGTETSDTERSHFKVTLTEGKAYRFEVFDNTDDDQDLWVYDNPDFSRPICTTRATEKNTVSGCTATTIRGGTAYLRTTSRDPYGAGFGLRIREVEWDSEGTMQSPVQIGAYPIVRSPDVARLEFDDGMVDGGNSYYKVDVSDGYNYVNFAVSLINQSADLDLYVYADSNYSNLLCRSVAAGLDDESCRELVPTDSSLYIRISGASGGFGGIFGLIVDHDYTTEGARNLSTDNGVIKAVPLSLGTPYQGQAPATNSWSYYYLETIEPGDYTVTVSELFDSACIKVYDEADGRFRSNNPYSQDYTSLDDKRVTKSFESGVFIRIGGCGYTNTGTAYTITIE